MDVDIRTTFNRAPRPGIVTYSKRPGGGHSTHIDVGRLVLLSQELRADRIDLKTYREELEGTTGEKLSPEELRGLSILPDQRDEGWWYRDQETRNVTCEMPGDVDLVLFQVNRSFFWLYVVHNNLSLSKHAHGPFPNELSALVDLVQNINPKVLEMIGITQHSTES